MAAPETSTLQAIHINHLINIKLNDTNYLLWKTQFKPLLKGYRLEGYVDGTYARPSPTIPNTQADLPPLSNPAYEKYEQQDHILLGWLLSSLTEGVLGRVSGLTTSKEVWDALEKRYAPKTRAHQMNLRRQLMSLRKGNSSMYDYFAKSKQLFDALTASGNALSEDDMQQSILSGLDQAYDSIVTSLSTVEKIDMDAFYAHLIAYDMRLDQQLSFI